MAKADLSSARAKLNWANSQIQILDVEIRLFIEREPYRFREKPKPHFEWSPADTQPNILAKGRFFEIVLLEDIPHTVKASVGMIIQAQRDSLDHLAHALAKKNGAIEATDAYFVISDTEAGFADARAQRKLRRLSEEDREVIKALKPYGGGNDLLYSLHWLNNKSKHRDLMAIATDAQQLQIRAKPGTGGGHMRELTILPPGNKLKPKEQIIIFDADENVELALSATIAFREVGHTQGQPVIETLREFSRLTNSIVDLFS